MTRTETGKDQFAKLANVSHETIERFSLYAELLRLWNPAAGLVAESTLPDLWTRHFLDSAQLLKSAPDSPNRWIDLGAGGGFPGLALALLCAKERPEDEFLLVESNGRKCEFLKTVCRETCIQAEILQERAETLKPQAANVATARALCSLPQLLSYAARHLVEGGLGLFHKGSGRLSEIDDAMKEWAFKLTELPSITDENGAILQVVDIRRI